MELSIVIPFYRGEPYINNLLGSIFASANGNSLDFNVEVLILIDSVETDENALIRQISIFAHPYITITVEKNPKNIGVAATRNRAIALTKGKQLLFIDQDDLVDAAYFQHISKALLQGFDFILYNGSFQIGSKVNFPIYYFRPAISLKSFILDDFIRSPGQVIIRREIIAQAGFPEPLEYHGADDKFCWVMIFHQHPSLTVKYIHQPLYIANIHEENYSHDQHNLLKSTLDLWSVTLDKYPSLKDNAMAQRNIRMLQFRMGNLSGWEKIKGGIDYFFYKMKPNKIVRKIMKQVLLTTNK